jgi:hypothetical protein
MIKNRPVLPRGRELRSAFEHGGQRMSRLPIAMLAAALCLACGAARAQEEYGRDSNRPRSQHDIIRERANACKGLKGEALSECLENYVGPRDRGWRRPASPPRGQGRA